jgi:hypothetical protein
LTFCANTHTAPALDPGQKKKEKIRKIIIKKKREKFLFLLGRGGEKKMQ